MGKSGKQLRLWLWPYVILKIDFNETPESEILKAASDWIDKTEIKKGIQEVSLNYK